MSTQSVSVRNPIRHGNAGEKLPPEAKGKMVFISAEHWDRAWNPALATCEDAFGESFAWWFANDDDAIAKAPGEAA